MKAIYAVLFLIGTTLYGLTGYSVVSGILSPSEHHLERATRLHPDVYLIQIGFSSGGYSCVNDVCDYSGVYDQKQYADLAISKVITIKKDYFGIWHESIEEISVEQKLIFFMLYMFLGVAMWYSVKNRSFV